jgi:hypothetical protein
MYRQSAAIAQKHELCTNKVLARRCARSDWFARMNIEARAVVVIGGSSGSRLAIARQAVDGGANVTKAGRLLKQEVLQRMRTASTLKKL